MPRRKGTKSKCSVTDSHAHDNVITNQVKVHPEEKTSVFPENYNNIRPKVVNSSSVEKSRITYIASACHVCKATEGPTADVLLSCCSGCRMIKYCSKDHQLEDWKNHKQLCNIIRKYLKSENKKHLYEECSELVQSQAEWLQIRFHYMQYFRDQLNRELQPYEKELLLFPLCFCTTCPPEAKLTLCKICHHHHHQSDLSTKSENKWCEEFRLWLALVRWESNVGLLKPDLQMEYVTPTEQEFPNDIQTYLSLQSFPDIIPENLQRAVTSEVATVPFSILWAILGNTPWLTQAPTLIVHLIGAEMDFEGNHPTKWETFLLHTLPNVKNLKLVLIGPELIPDSTVTLLCQTCQHKGIQLSLNYESGVLYHEYAQAKRFERPNIICAFNCGIYRKTGFNGEDTWAPTIPFLADADLLIVTAYTETEISQDSRRLLSECSGLRLNNLFRENPFRSLRPQRTLINEDVQPLMYKNQYIVTFCPTSIRNITENVRS